MYYRQRGFFSNLITGVSLFIPIIFFVRAVTFFIPKYINLVNEEPLSVVLSSSISFFVPIVLYLVIPVYIGIFLSGLFPLIYLSKRGIDYIYFGGVIRKKILWKEVEVTRRLPGGYWAICVDRPGLPIFNGLYMNELYGRLLRCGRPIILLSPKIDNLNKLLKEVESGFANINLKDM